MTAGIYAGHQSARLAPQARIAERFNWRTVQFVLENGVFLLMGVQLSGLVAQIEDGELPWHQAVALGVLLAGILIVLRFAFVWPLLALVRGGERRSARRADRATAFEDRVRALDTKGSARAERRVMGFLRRTEQARNDVRQLQAEGLGWRGGVVLGWAGMRGVVTLAAAQSLPRDTPYYEQLVLIAFTVAIVTLLLQGGTLPFVIRLTGIRGTDRTADRRELATLLDEMQAAGLAALDETRLQLPGGAPVDPAVVERVRHDTSLAAAVAWELAEHDEDDILRAPHQQYRELRRDVLQAEREVLLDARSRGAYPSRILQRAQAMLDLEEARLEQMQAEGRD